MTHEFSAGIHTFISGKIEACQQTINEAESNKDEKKVHYQNGKLKEFLRIRKLMKDSIDLDTQNYY